MDNERFICAETGKMVCKKSFAETHARSKALEIGDGIAIKNLTCTQLPQDGTRHCIRVKATPKPRWCRHMTIEIDVYYETDGARIRYLDSVLVSPAQLLVRSVSHLKVNAATA